MHFDHRKHMSFLKLLTTQLVCNKRSELSDLHMKPATKTNNDFVVDNISYQTSYNEKHIQHVEFK